MRTFTLRMLAISFGLSIFTSILSGQISGVPSAPSSTSNQSSGALGSSNSPLPATVNGAAPQQSASNVQSGTPTKAAASNASTTLTQNSAPVDATSIKSSDLVIVSKVPEYISYTLPTLAILLSVITIIIGIFGGLGLSLVVKIHKEKTEIEKQKLTFEELKNSYSEKLQKEHLAMLEALKRAAFGMAKLSAAKREASNLLTNDKPDTKRLFSVLQKTVAYPDLECLRLYAATLQKCEGNVDLVRVVRNGLLQFHRNPGNLTFEEAARTTDTKSEERAKP